MDKMNKKIKKCLVQACYNKNNEHIPIWLMRQAGRYMQSYRILRKKYYFIDLLKNYELSHEVTMQPVKKFNMDAAIVFSDILVTLYDMGLKIVFPGDAPPRIDNPIRTIKDVENLSINNFDLSYSTFKTINLTKKVLKNTNKAVIGFAGTPFTLACYAFEGTNNKNFHFTKEIMYSNFPLWDMLMKKLSSMIKRYIMEQIKFGADVIQFFDTWGGILSLEDYMQYAYPYMNEIINHVKKNSNVPIIYFSKNTGSYINEIIQKNIDVLSIDWTTPLEKIIYVHKYNKSIQGNLDPSILLYDWHIIKPKIEIILNKIKNSGIDFKSYIFNLGHGILPPTSEYNVKKLVEYVHSFR